MSTTADWTDPWLTGAERRGLRTLESLAASNASQKAQHAAEDRRQRLAAQAAQRTAQAQHRARYRARQIALAKLAGLILAGCSIPLFWGAIIWLIAP